MLTINSYPRLISDIGGTNARFALEVAPNKLKNIKTLLCKNYSSLAQAINDYLAQVAYPKIKHALLAIPGPIVEGNDNLTLLNSPWKSVSRLEIQQLTKLSSFVFLNDFHALALSLPFIPQDKLVKVTAVSSDENKPRCVIGVGTGLGMGVLLKTPINNDYFALPTEGGHSSFPIFNEQEFELWKFIRNRHSHVSAERLLSGMGLELIYQALCHQKMINVECVPSPEDITKRGITNQCVICNETLHHFCRMLGTVTANLACMSNAYGGVYIGGGIVPRILDFFLKSDFKSRFCDKGRLSSYMSNLPIYVIMHNYPALFGSVYALNTYLSL